MIAKGVVFLAPYGSSECIHTQTFVPIHIHNTVHMFQVYKLELEC